MSRSFVGSSSRRMLGVESAPLPAGELADGLALELGGEEEALHHLAGGEAALLGLDLAGDLVDEVKDALVQVQLPALLGEVADADRLAPVDGAAVGEELAGDEI